MAPVVSNHHRRRKHRTASVSERGVFKKVFFYPVKNIYFSKCWFLFTIIASQDRDKTHFSFFCPLRTISRQRCPIALPCLLCECPPVSVVVQTTFRGCVFLLLWVMPFCTLFSRLVCFSSLPCTISTEASKLRSTQEVFLLYILLLLLFFALLLLLFRAPPWFILLATCVLSAARCCSLLSPCLSRSFTAASTHLVWWVLWTHIWRFPPTILLLSFTEILYAGLCCVSSRVGGRNL